MGIPCLFKNPQWWEHWNYIRKDTKDKNNNKREKNNKK